MSRLIQLDDDGQKWLIIVEVGRDALGGRHRKQETFEGGRRAAERRERQLQAHYDGLGRRTPGKLTVRGLYEAWRELRFPQLKPKTAERYEELMRLHFLPTLGEVKAEKLEPVVLARLWNQLATSGKRPPQNRGQRKGEAPTPPAGEGQGPRPSSEPNTTTGLAPRTVWHVYRAAAAMWRWGVDVGLVTGDPFAAKSARPPKPRRANVTAYDLGRALAVVEECRGTQMHTAAFLSLLTGMRLEECCGLSWSDVDLERGEAHVTQVVSALKDGSLLFVEPKTQESARRLDLLPMVVSELKAVKAWQDRQRLHCGAGWNERDLVCVKPNGEPLNPRHLSGNWKDWRKRHGHELTFHGLRHTWATFIAGVLGIKAAKDELGHTDIKTTDGYAHVLDEQRKAMLALKDAAVAAAIAQYGQEMGREGRKVVGIEAATGCSER